MIRKKLWCSCGKIIITSDQATYNRFVLRHGVLKGHVVTIVRVGNEKGD